MNFAQQFHALFPAPDKATTEDWMRFIRGSSEDDDSEGRERYMGEVLDALTFITRYFSAETGQRLYELGGGILPTEQVLAAICLETGHPPEQVMEMARYGRFECGLNPEKDWRSGQLAVYTFAGGEGDSHALRYCHDPDQLQEELEHAGRIRYGHTFLESSYYYPLPQSVDREKLTNMVRRCPAFACHILSDSATGAVEVLAGAGAPEGQAHGPAGHRI